MLTLSLCGWMGFAKQFLCQTQLRLNCRWVELSWAFTIVLFFVCFLYLAHIIYLSCFSKCIHILINIQILIRNWFIFNAKMSDLPRMAQSVLVLLVGRRNTNWKQKYSLEGKIHIHNSQKKLDPKKIWIQKNFQV